MHCNTHPDLNKVNLMAGVTNPPRKEPILTIFKGRLNVEEIKGPILTHVLIYSSSSCRESRSGSNIYS